jgi:hypothetical protein
MFEASPRHKFLHFHAVVNFSEVNRPIFSHGNVVASIDLSIVVSEAAPLREDFPIQIQLEDASPVRWRGLRVATSLAPAAVVDFAARLVANGFFDNARIYRSDSR